MSKDERLVRENEELMVQKRLSELMDTDNLRMVDSSYQPDSSFSVYVYSNSDIVWYIVNDGGNYYSVYESLHELINYTEQGSLDNRYLDLTAEQFKEFEEIVLP